MDADGFIETKDLTKAYVTGAVEVAALRGVTLSIARGQLVGITGASGSGKSTLMNLLGGLDTPSSGSIRVAGRLISDLSKKELALYRRNTVGMIFQSFNLVNAYTAIENVALPLLFAGVAKKERLHRAAGAAAHGGPGSPQGPPADRAIGRGAAAGGDCQGPGQPAADSSGG